MTERNRLFEKIFTIGTSLLVFLLPLFFLPITTNFYGFNKNILLYLGVAILTLVWAVKVALNKEIKLNATFFDLPVLLLATAWVLAMIFRAPNRVEALWLSGGTGTILALTFFYFILTNNLRPENWKRIRQALMASSLVLSVIAIYQYLGLGESLISETSAWAWMRTKTWTPTGSPLTSIIFLAANLPLLVTSFLKSLNPGREERRPFLNTVVSGVASVVVIVGSVITISQMLPSGSNPLALLPYSSSWAIAIESFKQSPLLGVGPTNFISAFNRFRPISYNNLSFWNQRFLSGGSWLLQVLTETGILGLGVLVSLIVVLLKRVKSWRRRPGLYSVLVTLLLLIFLPGNFLSLLAFYIFLAMVTSKTEKNRVSLHPQISLVPLILIVIGLGISFYFAGRTFAGEVYFKRSLDALVQNRGIDTYNQQIQAITLAPSRTDFRLAYSQINLALANSLASKEEITDQDRNNISQLVQQAIREARIATTLNPTDAGNWENLALLYRNLINFAEGADQWAIAAYQQTIATDPINPRHRLDLGGIFYALGNFEEAVRQFRHAVDLKPDLANGYYNLAVAYREQQRYSEAYQAMQITLNLIPVESPDWQKAKDELDQLAKLLPPPAEQPAGPEAEVPPEEVLTEPQPLPSPVLEPPLEIEPEPEPEEATPTPTPTP